jgi:hypothetical protein
MSATVSTSTTQRDIPARVTSLGWILLLIGIVTVAAGYLVDPKQAAFHNIIGFLFVTSIGAGSIFLIALEYIAGAVWSVPFRRVTESLAGIIPFAALLAVPMLFNMHDLFHWTHADAVASDELLRAKAPYLNVQFFLIRFVAIFVIWTLFSWLFARNSRKQDISRDPKLTTTNIRLAAIFMPVFAITITLTAVDWAMSLEPHWFSTILGVYYFSGSVLAALAALTYIVVTLMQGGYLPGIRRDHLYSLGALMFAFTNFWAYIAFSQFLLIWYANLPEETIWFLARWKNGWEIVSVLLIVVRFAVPYIVLLSQDSKMDPRRLKFIGLWLLAAHLLDLYWLVMPTFSPDVTLSWMLPGFILLAIGLIIVLVTLNMKRYNLMPVGDPKLTRGLEFHL